MAKALTNLKMKGPWWGPVGGYLKQTSRRIVNDLRTGNHVHSERSEWALAKFPRQPVLQLRADLGFGHLRIIPGRTRWERRQSALRVARRSMIRPEEPVEQATEVFAAVYLFVVGLSHLLQPQVWVEFFAWMREKGRAGMLVEGLMSLGFGALIVAFHNVWSGLAVVLTLIGWGQVLKGTLRLVAPQLSLRVYQRMTPERAWLFRVGGVFALALSGLLAYVALSR